jgi:hypothetical protein
MIDLSALNQLAHRCLKHSQATPTDFGGTQTAFLDPSVDRPLTDLQQLGRFLDTE